MLNNGQEIADELENVALQLADRSMQAEVTDSEQSQIFAKDIKVEFERIQLLSELTEFPPLQVIGEWLTENATQAAEKPEVMALLQTNGHFFQWAEVLASAIRQPDGILLPLLNEALQHEDWPIAMPGDKLATVLLALMSRQDSNTQDTSPVQEVVIEEPVASVETNSQYKIQWDNDVHPEILDAFLQDTPDQIAESTALIHKIVEGKASHDEHKLAARLTHTVKGASGVVGVTGLIAFTHQLEEILEYSVDNTLPADTQDLLSASADCLDSMGEAMLHQQPMPLQFEPLLAELEKAAKQLHDDSEIDDVEEEIVFDAPPVKAFVKEPLLTPTATPETKTNSQYKIQWDNDVHPEILDAFLQDTPDQIAESAALIHKIVEGKASQDEHKLAARLTHTVKGASGVVGVTALIAFTHQLEEILEYSVNNTLPVDAQNLLSASADCLDSMGEAMLHQQPMPLQFEPLLTELEKTAKQLNDTDTSSNYEFDDAEEIVFDAPPVKAKAVEEAVPLLAPTPTSDINNQYQIQWDDGVHPEILEAFLSDTPDQIAESTALIHKIASGDANQDEHKLAARLIHTVKGASGVVGVTALIAFTHQLEEILEYSVDNKLSSGTQKLLSASADCLDSMGEAMLNQQPMPLQFEPLLAELETTAQQLNIDETSTHVDTGESTEEEIIFDVPSAKAKDDEQQVVTKKTALSPLSSELLTSQELLSTGTTQQVQQPTLSRGNEPTMRVPVSLIDDLLNLAEELVTSTSQVRDNVKDVLIQCQSLKTDDERINDNMAELEKSIDLQLKQVQVQLQANDDSEFDELELEVYNELHSSYNLLDETLGDSREIQRSLQQNLRQLNDKLHSHQRINRELNATILNTRMESLDSLTPRLERIIRETCRSTGKKATLNITGSNLAVDTDILKGLTDPLLHLLRNSVDHGIETIEERAKQSKEEDGKIELTFNQEGRYVIMTLVDDGAGIDAEAIYRRALTKNLVSKTQVLTENEKLELILLAGFSTRDAVSNISGRGVGMDVVQDAVSRLRGTLSLTSKPGQGTRISIRLPLTLVAANTIMVTASDTTVAVPIDSIERLHTIKAGEILSNGSNLSAVIDHKNYEVIQLSELLGWGNPLPDLTQDHPVILLMDRQHSYALIVDEVLQPREVVVKSLAPWLSNVVGLNGACLLSDGDVAAVLDLPRLLQLLSESERSAFEENIEKVTDESIVMIVDDSLSNRKALSITAQQLGYKVMTAIDGQDALDQMAEVVPDIILSDLEMPRMNGLELTKAIRLADRLVHIPLVMITSRATKKHLKQAQLAGVNDYLIKPVDRETLQNRLEKWLK